MLSEPKPPVIAAQFIAAQNDAELEWLLCLASALQVGNNEAAKAAAASDALPAASLLQELKNLLKGLRRPERIRAV